MGFLIVLVICLTAAGVATFTSRSLLLPDEKNERFVERLDDGEDGHPLPSEGNPPAEL